MTHPKVDDEELNKLAQSAVENERLANGQQPIADPNIPEAPVSSSVETPANSPDNINSEEPLPEDPSARSIDDYQKPNGLHHTEDTATVPETEPTPGDDAEVDRLLSASPSLSTTDIPAEPAAPVFPPTEHGAAAASVAARDAGLVTANAQKAVGQQQGVERLAQAEGHDSAAAQFSQQAQEIKDQENAHQKGLAEAHAIADQAEQKARDFKFHDWWGDQSIATKIQSKIGIFFGGLGAGLTGTENTALKQINMLSERAFAQQRQELAKLDNFAKWKQEGETHLGARFQQERMALGLEQSKALEATAEEIKAEILRNGGTIDQANNNVAVQKLQQSAAEKYATNLENLVKFQSMLALAKAKQAQSNTSSPAAVAEVNKMMAQGKPMEDIADFAAKNNVSTKDVGLIARTTKNYGGAALPVLDADGNPAGISTSTEDHQKATKGRAALVQYLSSVDKLEKDERDNGPVASVAGVAFTKKGAQREANVADVMKNARLYYKFASAEHAQILERASLGRTGGVLQGGQTDPEILAKLRDDAKYVYNTDIMGRVRPASVPTASPGTVKIEDLAAKPAAATTKKPGRAVPTKADSDLLDELESTGALEQ